MKLLAFAASHRTASVNRKLVKLASNIAKKKGVAIDSIEYGAFDMPVYDDEIANAKSLPAAAKKFVTHLNKADGILLSSPEYNWSFPGSLKNIIDWASIVTPNPFAGKTILLLSASPSLRGGAQGLIHLKVPLEALGMFVFPQVFALARANEVFDSKGALKEPKLARELSQLVTDFLAMTVALKAA